LSHFHTFKMNTPANLHGMAHWPPRNGQPIPMYAIKIVLLANDGGISVLPDNIQSLFNNTANQEIENTFLGNALSDAMQLCLQAVPHIQVASLEQLIHHVLTTPDLHPYLTGTFASYLDNRDFSFFKEASLMFQILHNDESIETIQSVCVFLSLVALVRFIGSNDSDAGELLLLWNEHYVDSVVSDSIAYTVSIQLLDWIVAFYDTMNVHNIAYEQQGIFGSDYDLDFFQITTQFVNTNNLQGIMKLFTLDRFWPDSSQEQTPADIFACRGLDPSVLFTIMQRLGGRFEHAQHTFETAFMDWMSTHDLIASLINDTESLGFVNKESDPYKKLIKCIHVLQMLLAHSPPNPDLPQEQCNVSLPFKFLLWILRSFGLQDTQLNSDITEWIHTNGEQPFHLFGSDLLNCNIFCGLSYSTDDYGNNIRDFLHLPVDKAQLFIDDNKHHKSLFCTNATTLHAIHKTTTTLFQLFKFHFSSEIQGCTLTMQHNCYQNANLHYNPSLHIRYADRLF